ncbi:MAG: endonuclease/exonuclease/phosphatase family protein [Actinomycetota bacterium]|nr:endonuclease/exonuclease/phosphatase family protein [Actinomycetota bacterium]
MALRVLTWNLMHGRSLPPAGRYLEDEFVAALARWEWDVALLQEVPPWWPPALAARLRADQRLVLTSRNSLLPVRRALAIRWPDLIKSNGGGANAILTRRGEILDHRTFRLSWFPERRWVHAIQLAGADGSDAPLWVANLHLTVRNPKAAMHEASNAGDALLDWAAGAPALLGGDFNVPSPSALGFEPAGGHNVDHVLVSGLRATSDPEVLVRGLLSDHAPVAVDLARSSPA